MARAPRDRQLGAGRAHDARACSLIRGDRDGQGEGDGLARVPAKDAQRAQVFDTEPFGWSPRTSQVQFEYDAGNPAGRHGRDESSDATWALTG